MFSSVLNFFKKPQTSQEPAKKEENTKNPSSGDDSYNEFLKSSSSQQEAISKFEVKSEVSAYFISLEELGPRQVKVESENECQEMLNYSIEKRMEIYLEKLKNWKYLIIIKKIDILN